jgi:hypothetical protein
MRAYIGPYRNRWNSNIHARHMEQKYGVDWDDNKDWEDRAWEWFEDKLQSLYNATINRILDKKDRTIDVRIDRQDTWSMDSTLAHIIVPMLKQLKETKHGSPFVDDEDVPEELRSTSAPPKENDWDIDDNHHARWNWVLDEVIWAFEQKTYSWEEQYYGEWVNDENEDSLFGGRFVNSDDEGLEAHQKRMSNGFKLFGKYYEAFWD